MPYAHPQAQDIRLVGQSGGTTEFVALQGNYTYVGVGPRLVVLDVSNPAHPVYRAQTESLPGFVEEHERRLIDGNLAQVEKVLGEN